MKKIISLLLLSLISIVCLASCGSNDDTTINLYSREDGSGTRGAFIELFGIEQKNEQGEKIDKTSLSATITNSTSVMLTNIQNDKNGIGYVSLGSLSDDVKAVKIDGAAASVENIKNGTYKIAIPFNIVTKDTLSEAAQDFYNFILSNEGQAVISGEGYIPVTASGAFASNGATGTVKISGSSSVYPVMEKLVEKFKTYNSSITIELQLSDSGTGVKDAINGTSDIGMASRNLKDSETGVKATCIATDGIAVIVNKDSSIDSLTSEQVMKIFTAEITDWSEINE